ncbi:MAG: MerR family transcriptional regulator [Firmicutes bacterium]|nr:MerR family transcriptional regulator [Bacillota bacterium]
MEVRNCRRCGKMFVYLGRDVCPQCRAEEEQEFEEVRDYLRKSPYADLEELHRETGVKKETILSFLREGRLEVLDTSLGGLGRCRICGTKISQGRICQECLRSFKVPPKKGKELAGGRTTKEAAKDGKRLGGRMYTANRVDRRRRK